jgi:hypothetical protein
MSDLSAAASHEYHDELARSLVPPIPDTLELRERRLSTALDTFQALRPGDSYEARLMRTVPDHRRRPAIPGRNKNTSGTTANAATADTPNTSLYARIAACLFSARFSSPIALSCAEPAA